jgi:hypothetical protein
MEIINAACLTPAVLVGVGERPYEWSIVNGGNGRPNCQSSMSHSDAFSPANRKWGNGRFWCGDGRFWE